MAGDSVTSFNTRNSPTLQRARRSIRKCCCTKLQFRASCILFVSISLIFVSESLGVASYLVFIGSTGIFFGIFLILLDFALFLQTKSERHRRRFGQSDEEAVGGDTAIWATSVYDRGRSLSFASPPPDYQTTINQPDVFPLYLQDGVPMTSLSASIVVENDGCVDEEEDKLPSYSEIMEDRTAEPSS
ncbi:uncharacterized protein LOC135155761 [Lytechinus pictus]|uniref:uncharacterized protein LOC135155761 n=1 Tax=Lytechinus pictus TaxID=7653 RepID=UPI0030BA17DD